jgi:hypothetical protein
MTAHLIYHKEAKEIKKDEIIIIFVTMGTIWLKARIWKLSGIKRGFERGRYPLGLGKENAKHILLKSLQTK